jgi:hypothetical protein
MVEQPEIIRPNPHSSVTNNGNYFGLPILNFEFILPSNFVKSAARCPLPFEFEEVFCPREIG